MDELKNAEKYLVDLFTEVKLSYCSRNEEHKGKFNIAFVCDAPECNRRLICTMCMVAEEDHRSEHRSHIKRLNKSLDILSDRLKDTFASDLGLITKYVIKFKLECVVEYPMFDSLKNFASCVPHMFFLDVFHVYMA